MRIHRATLIACLLSVTPNAHAALMVGEVSAISIMVGLLFGSFLAGALVRSKFGRRPENARPDLVALVLLLVITIGAFSVFPRPDSAMAMLMYLVLASLFIALLGFLCAGTVMGWKTGQKK